MDYYTIPFEQFSGIRPWPFTKLPDVAALNRLIAEEVVTALKEAVKQRRRLVVICPVGPLDYSYWAEVMNREHVDGSALVTVNMDEYLAEDGDAIPESHPLSFRRFMNAGFFDRLQGSARVPADNIVFPDPRSPDRTTAFLEACGGADICYGGMGLTGHFAFNDPPEADSRATPPPSAIAELGVLKFAAKARPRCAWAGLVATGRFCLAARLPSVCTNC